jgi:methylmalonyl-CoA/ethylmalonyl-CoA epimerase
MSMISSHVGRLDHVGIAVRDADAAIPYYRDTLGFPVVGDEIATDPGVRLVYLDAGNAFIQLVEPVRDDAPVAVWLQTHPEGLHHVCFRTDDLRACERELNGPGDSSIFRAGRGDNAFFLTTEPSNTKIEIVGPPPVR